MNVRRSTSRRNRRAHDPSNRPVGSLIAAVSAVVGTKARLTFPTPVILVATPTDITYNGGACLNAAIISPGVIDLGFAATPVATGTLVIPGNSPSIRPVNGGYVAAATKTF